MRLPNLPSGDLLAARKAFTVAFGTADTATQCDYLGIVSGNKTPDKVSKSGFTLTKSEFVDAPVINELPLVLECSLASMNEGNCNVVGKIVNCAVEESTLTDGKPLAFDEVEGVDARRWKSKGILVVYAKDGRHFILDTWHHVGAKELAEKIMDDVRARTAAATSSSDAPASADA